MVEGPRLLSEALAASAPVEEAFVEPGAPAGLVEQLLEAGVAVHRVAAGVLDRAGEARTSQGIAAVALAPPLEPPASLAADPVVLVLVGVADPGNVGTLLRTADAAEAAVVLLCGPCADPLSPKVVRAAAGALFRLRLAELGDPAELPGLLDVWRVAPLGCVARGGRPLDEVDLTGAVALVLGSEAHGLPPALATALADAGQLLSIPMPGPAESLNVAMAGTVVAYEAVRQRRLVGRPTRS